MERRVLVVDNSPIVLEYMQQVLAEAGCTVITANNGLEALSVVDEADPTILFTDMIMPYVDGFRLIRALRSRKRWKNLFIVALSAIARESELDMEALQVDLCIAKGPLREMSKHVLAALAEAENGHQAERPRAVIGLESVYERQVTGELLSELGRYAVLTDSLSDGVLTTSSGGLVVAANRAAQTILGMSEELLLGRSMDTVPLEPYTTGSSAELANSFPEAESGTLYRIRDAIVVLTELPVVDKLQDLRVILLRDVTQLVTSRQRLHKALEDRELLLREAHHRVKNNLATISSLISLQVAALSEGNTRTVLEHLRGQIESIGLVHDRIYRSDSFSTVDFQEYARDLLGNLIKLHGASRSVHYSVVGETFPMGPGTAIPLGLSLSELIINSLKHGFPDGRSGTIDLRLTSAGEKRWLLEFQDDGVGIPEGIDPRSSKTLGVRVLAGLATQLGGSITFPIPPARAVRIEFSSVVL